MEINDRKMKIFFRIIVSVSVFVFCSSVLQARENVSILREDNIVKIDINYSSFKNEKIKAERRVYDKISLDDAGFLNKPGFPMVPVAVALLNVSSEDISGIEIVNSELQTLSGYNLLPSPSKEMTIKGGKLAARESYSENKEVYADNSFFPKVLFEKGESGIMRGKNFTQVVFYPLQFNPVTGEVKFYSKISARVRITSSPLEGASFRKTAKKKEEIHLKANYRKAKKTLKVTTGEEGIYKITYNDIKKAGLKPSKIKTSTIKIYNKGSESAVSIRGKKKKYFKKFNSIIFYAEQNKSEYSDTNVFWLVWGGAAGKRMSVYNGKKYDDSLTGPSSFIETVHFEKNNDWVQTVPHEEGKDHWMWGGFFIGTSSSDGTKTVNFSLDGLYEGSSDAVTMTVALLGVTTFSGTDTDHHTKIYVNNNLVDDFLWDGENEKIITTTFSADILDPLSNTLTIKEIADQGAVYDAAHLNWFDIVVNKTFTASNDILEFECAESGARKMSVGEFTKKSVYVFDITEPVSPQIIKIKKQNISAGKYNITFADTISSSKTYLALTKKKFKKPLNISTDKYSKLTSAGKGADYIIISHKDFIKSAKALANYRKSQGMTVKVADVQDVYDEFSDGLFDPQAIRDFLKYAYENWNPKPFYVLLIGDANYDYMDYKEKGVKNYIPVKLVHTSTLGPTPSDNWYVTVDGIDDLPDMAIGRIPARTSAEIDNAINKIMSYETSPSPGNWNENVIFAADKNDPGAGDFASTSDDIAFLLPTITYTVSKYHLDDYYNSGTKKTDVDTANADLISAMNDGVFMINYMGHGSLGEWAAVLEKDSASGSSGSLFSKADISSLSNSGKLPLVLALDCFNGFFASPEKECLAENMIREKDNGAVSFIGPSGAGFNYQSKIYGEEVFKTLFDGKGEKVAGIVFNEAKKNSYGKISEDNINDIIYFGDPATKLNLPQ